MKRIIGLFLFFLFKTSFAQEKVEDYLNIGKIYKFDDKEYNLAWSSHPVENFYKQEYILPNEKVEHYSRMILIDFVEGDLTPEQSSSIMVNSLEESKKKNPLVKYVMFKKGDEYMLDFIVSENTEDNKNILFLERNVYRYFVVNTPKRKGVLLLGVSDRVYNKEDIDKMFYTLKNNQLDLINKVGEIPFPQIK